ncbi:hypothetical protein JW948_11220 [bacterium]|nr:hypothetical protein [bacterium]
MESSCVHRLFRVGILVFLLALGTVIAMSLNELVPVRNGLGWDGNVYGKTVMDFHGTVFRQGLSDYYVRRILPGSLVLLVLKLSGSPLDTIHVIRGFQIVNAIMILLGLWGWERTAIVLGISEKGKWMGFIGLFINFCVLKFNFFIPVLTDMTAFALGIWMCEAYFSKRRGLMLLILGLGFFTWPNFFLVLFPLLVWRNNIHDAAQAKKAAHWLSLGIILGLAAACMYCCHTGWSWLGSGMTMALLPVSMIFMSGYVYFSMRPVLQNPGLYKPGPLAAALRHPSVLCGMALFVLLTALVLFYDRNFASGSVWSYSTLLKVWLKNLVYLGNRKPGIFLVAHMVYYGPFLMLTMIHFRLVVQKIREYGTGLSVVILIALFMSINPESRQLIHFYSLFVVLTVMAVDSRLTRPVLFVLGGLSLLYSKMWILVNTPEIPAGTDYLSQPWQKLFMSIGWTMSDFSYWFQTAVLAVTALALFLLLHKNSAADGHTV